MFGMFERVAGVRTNADVISIVHIRNLPMCPVPACKLHPNVALSTISSILQSWLVTCMKRGMAGAEPLPRGPLIVFTILSYPRSS